MNETIGKPWVWTQQNSTLISHDIKKAHNCLLQSELSHKEKHRYCILTHIYGIQKDGNDDPIHEAAKETQM